MGEKCVKLRMLLCVAVVFCLSIFFGQRVWAEEFGRCPDLDENLKMENRSYGLYNYNHTGNTFLYVDGAGNLCAVYVKGSRLQVLTFTKAGTVQNQKNIQLPFSRFGGYYHGSDGCHYVAVGTTNEEESRTKPVIKILRYSAGWQLLGTADIPGGIRNEFTGIYSPFSAGQGEMTLYGNDLIFHTNRLMFGMAGLHHESNITLVVDTRTMQLKEAYSQPFISHSMSQLVKTEGNLVSFVSHADGGNRGICMDNYMDYGTEKEKKQKRKKSRKGWFCFQCLEKMEIIIPVER